MWREFRKQRKLSSKSNKSEAKGAERAAVRKARTDKNKETTREEKPCQKRKTKARKANLASKANEKRKVDLTMGVAGKISIGQKGDKCRDKQNNKTRRTQEGKQKELKEPAKQGGGQDK